MTMYSTVPIAPALSAAFAPFHQAWPPKTRLRPCGMLKFLKLRLELLGGEVDAALRRAGADRREDHHARRAGPSW